MVRDRIEPYDVTLDEEHLEAAIDMVVRVVLSHVMQPSASPVETADDIAWIAARVLREPMRSRVGGCADLRLGTPTARAVIAAAVLGSGMAMLDGTVVNVALRTIGRDLDASLAELQWITNGYLLSLASLILLGGSLGDRFGRRRVFVIGTVWFALGLAALRARAHAGAC